VFGKGIHVCLFCVRVCVCLIEQEKEKRNENFNFEKNYLMIFAELCF